jgi:hypothetical protein
MLRRCLIVLFLSLMGCREANVADLPGTYHAKGDWGESQLTLNPDHTMEQIVTTPGAEARRLSGKWEAASGHITLIPCFALAHDRIGEQVVGCSSGFSEFLPGKIEIALDPDFGLAYRK